MPFSSACLAGMAFRPAALHGLALAASPLRSAETVEQEVPSAWSNIGRFFAGAVLGAVLIGGAAGPARADLEDTLIPVDGKGKTATLTKEQLVRAKRLFNNACAICHVGGGNRTNQNVGLGMAAVRAKRLFNNACAICHVGGGNRTNQNVGLGMEELQGGLPTRATVEGIVNFLNAPVTYDGLKDVSETHPSIKSADLFPKMRSMKQQDLVDISMYILYQNFTIP
eukprot:CAMPEP_0183484166 /NCGR_PEP_ID=MMETSP0370-20130417/178784_1 /TAXON_ID=268820 /ORGANISM="Peridinium aciculiferum, Strain PAER-2" /LENGTH=224 /DNA_ID=CAMNT_0025677453 /DNA_START=112 /DNA_END=782 /DNA_ORIENTATION=+